MKTFAVTTWKHVTQLSAMTRHASMYICTERNSNTIYIHLDITI